VGIKVGTCLFNDTVGLDNTFLRNFDVLVGRKRGCIGVLERILFLGAK
jgi:hypothetical protein